MLFGRFHALVALKAGPSFAATLLHKQKERIDLWKNFAKMRLLTDLYCIHVFYNYLSEITKVQNMTLNFYPASYHFR